MFRQEECFDDGTKILDEGFEDFDEIDELDEELDVGFLLEDDDES